MLRNLVAEIKRNGLNTKEISESLGIHNTTFHSKLRGESEFSYSQANVLLNKYFPSLEADYLFENK